MAAGAGREIAMFFQIVVAQMATHIALVRAGQFAGYGPAKLVLERRESGYAQELAAAVPEIPSSGQV
jgi:ABC-type glutathione transport system ATPase component